MMRLSITYFLLLAFALAGNGQYIFERNDSIPVNNGSIFLTNPWAGGLNWGQYSKIDLDQDGLKDLFVFDRSGNVVVTFRNEGSPGIIDYVHDFKYQPMFPALHDWALLADYNCDGKNDIFSYSTGGFNIYKNTSTPGSLQFQLLPETMPYTRTSALGNDINLYVSSVDIPAIVDVDNDSDLDVLTFDIFGSTIEYHQNLGVDSFGTCDSIRYLLSNMCWGHFRENGLSNNVNLFDTCGLNVSNPKITPLLRTIKNFNTKRENNTERDVLRHAGATVLALDLDGNGVKELVIGDVSFPSLTMLTNGGTVVNTNTSMIAQDTAFPENNMSTIPVDINVFPAGYYLDIDNDGVRDLMAAPNAQNVSENFTSSWYYRNDGNDSIPDFNFVQNNFLQGDMIEVGEGAYPQLFDYNADGLKDLIVANYGYHSLGGNYISGLAVYENVGTITDPQFLFITSDYMNLSSLGMAESVYPTFGDVDGDGDEDMFCGTWNGKIHYFENTAGAGNPANFVLTTPNYEDNTATVIDVGEFSTPQLFDLDRDNDLDLIIGERRGNLNYYENTGSSSSPVYELVDDTLGNITSTYYNENYGYSVPCFYEDSAEYRLFLGTQKGYVKYFENIEGNLFGTFNLVDSMYQNIWEGIRSGVWVEDINDDSIVDMFYGNYRGGLAFYKGMPTFNIGITEIFDPAIEFYPNPATNELTVVVSNFSGVLRVSITNLLGQELLSKNSNTGKMIFQIGELAQGAYLIQVSNSQRVTARKFVVTR